MVDCLAQRLPTPGCPLPCCPLSPPPPPFSAFPLPHSSPPLQALCPPARLSLPIQLPPQHLSNASFIRIVPTWLEAAGRHTHNLYLSISGFLMQLSTSAYQQQRSRPSPPTCRFPALPRFTLSAIPICLLLYLAFLAYTLHRTRYNLYLSYRLPLGGDVGLNAPDLVGKVGARNKVLPVLSLYVVSIIMCREGGCRGSPCHVLPFAYAPHITGLACTYVY